MSSALRIGTCSWKFPSWRGLVYSAAARPDYLREYAAHFDCVEIDQWYWSLFGPDKVVLPRREVAAQYAAAVPAGFRFGVKLPNALTLTHFRPARTGDPLVPNPHFLADDLLRRTLEQLEPLHGRLGPLMLQFSYLNRRMMPSQQEFLERLEAFVSRLPAGFTWGVESRNPQHLNAAHFDLLRRHGLIQVFEMGYYMPPLKPLYEAHAERLADEVVIRLHGPDWEGMDKRAGRDWSRVVAPRDGDLDALAAVLKDLQARQRKAWVFVNNHFEGCAPATIHRLRQRLAQGRNG